VEAAFDRAHEIVDDLCRVEALFVEREADLRAELAKGSRCSDRMGSGEVQFCVAESGVERFLGRVRHGERIADEGVFVRVTGAPKPLLAQLLFSYSDFSEKV